MAGGDRASRRSPIVAHSLGAAMANAWLARPQHASVDAFVALGMGVPFAAQRLPPVLDVTAEHDLPAVLASAPLRALALPRESCSATLRIDGADHFLGGHANELADAIAPFLARAAGAAALMRGPLTAAAGDDSVRGADQPVAHRLPRRACRAPLRSAACRRARRRARAAPRTARAHSRRARPAPHTSCRRNRPALRRSRASTATVLVAREMLCEFRQQRVRGDEPRTRLRRVVRRERARRARRRGIRLASVRAEHALDCDRRRSRPDAAAPARAPVNATIVLSMPTSQAPPSRISDTASPKSSATWCAVVGETWPKRLADGAAMPWPPSSRTRRAAPARPGATARAGRRCPGRR